MSTRKYKFVIATTKVPVDHAKFTQALHEMAEAEGVQCIAAKGQPSDRGCWNLGLIVRGPKKGVTNFMNSVTMAMQPARYAPCSTPDWDGFNYEGTEE